MVAGLLLIIANLTMTHSLASEGTHLTGLTKQQASIEQRIATLKEEIMDAQSLTRVEEKARSLGFVQAVQVHHVAGRS